VKPKAAAKARGMPRRVAACAGDFVVPARCGDGMGRGPADHDHARVVGGLNQDNLDGIAGLVDGAADKGRGGMIGRGGSSFPSRPRWLLATPIVADLCGGPQGPTVWLCSPADSARSLHEGPDSFSESASDKG
jgi:hypothetical protein